ncbi:ABC transporter ATP-binding protein [Anaerolentibacter hominis]|uniref:ABC transporter ATP-binding protein n=1 Tax=Anaerolentibacter hominis TaxID=3079009 RepID=UPI0031B808DE
MNEIELNGLTKSYGPEKGVFDLTLSVKKGEVFGFLGPNGAGKTTTIRQLMGFIKPLSGSSRIRGMDCFSESAEIKEIVGYLPGEIAFMDEMRGREFLEFMAKLKGMKERKRMHDLIERFDLDPSGRIRKMSKGMKQKIGLVCAFMDEPEILILDEPSSGLDPLMQNRFIELILEEKKAGRTIFLSSHIFEEIERTCDRMAMIKNGRLIATEEMKKLKKARSRQYILSFETEEACMAFRKEDFVMKPVDATHLLITTHHNLKPFLARACEYPINGLESGKESLEELFLNFYSEEVPGK